MANIFERAGSWFAQQIASYLQPERVDELNKAKQYYEGDQRPPLKLKYGQANDNLITNWISLAVDRSTSMLFGGGVDFVFKDEQSPQAVYVNDVWDANKKNIFLHRLATDGDVFGTPFIEIQPDGLGIFPRLILLDPRLMYIETDPLDIEKVIQYVFEVKLYDKVIRKITRRAGEEDMITNPPIEHGAEDTGLPDVWIIETWEVSGRSSVPKLIDKIMWPYNFPPVIHCQNLPSIHSVEGLSGIMGLDAVQDKYNFIVSNMLKISRYHSHPKTWGRGLPANAGLEKVSWGADEIVKITSENGMLANLEMNSDLASSRNIANDLRRSIFDIARVVDTETLIANSGNLTQFVLQAIYSDALMKNKTRRLLYGEMLKELNHRLLVIGGFEGADNEFEIQWGNELPADDEKNAQLILADLSAGLISQSTAAQKRGYMWDGIGGEKEKIAEEKANNTNLTNNALGNFLAGR